VFGTNAYSNQPGWNAAQHRKDVEELEERRRLRPLLGVENAADDPPLDCQLQTLGEPHRECASLFDRLKIGVRDRAAA
jgi:hypothetical protein